jgi:hypothetical protein
VNANTADFTYVGDPTAVFDLNGWYKDVNRRRQYNDQGSWRGQSPR